MPYDEQGFQGTRRSSLRAAVVDLMAKTAKNGRRSDAEFRAELSAIVLRDRDRAADLWLKYHGDRADPRARIYARYCY